MSEPRPPRGTDATIFQMATQIGGLIQAAADAKDSRTHMRREVGELSDAIHAMSASVSDLAATVKVQIGVTTEINSTLDDHEPRIGKLEKIEKDRFKRQVTLNGVMLGAGIGIGKAAEAWDWIKGLLQIGGKA